MATGPVLHAGLHAVRGTQDLPAWKAGDLLAQGGCHLGGRVTHGTSVLAPHQDVCKARERRVQGLLALGQLGGEKDVALVREDRLHGRVRGPICLHDNLAWAPSPAGPARHLLQEVVGPLGRAEVG